MKKFILGMMSDEMLIQYKAKRIFGEKFNLDNPQTYCEKLNWLKLNDRKPIYTNMVDKYEAKKYAAELIGEEHIIPNYGVWDSFEKIDFKQLPNQFVLKTTHDSGGIVVCRDKSSFDYEKVKRIMNKHLKDNHYKRSREWPYKNVKPRIIAEKYIDSLGKKDSIEYKATCFNGKVGFVTICQGIAHAAFELRTNDSFTVDFEHMPWYAYYKNAEVMPQKPEQWEEIIEISEKLSQNIPVLRVDLYVHEGKVYFGEVTFYTWGGFIEFSPPEWDEILGGMIDLNKLKD